MVAPTAHEPPRPRSTPAAPPPSGIVTPEAVVLEFADAGLGSRALGFVVDLGARVAVLWAVLTVFGFGGAFAGETVIVVAAVVAGFLVLFAYPVACETLWNGRTLGKMLLGLRVVTVEGAPVRFRHAVIRSALGAVDFLATVGCAAVLSALATRQSQRLGDLAAGTIVIRERQAGAYSQPILFQAPHGWEPWVAGVDVSALGEDDYVLVRTFLLRVLELREEARAARGAELAAWVASKIGVPVPAGHHPETFLVAVASAYQRRHGGAPRPVAPGGGHGLPSSVEPPAVWQEDQPSATWGTLGPSS